MTRCPHCGEWPEVPHKRACPMRTPPKKARLESADGEVVRRVNEDGSHDSYQVLEADGKRRLFSLYGLDHETQEWVYRERTPPPKKRKKRRSIARNASARRATTVARQ